jgi:hypothetical protein
MDVKKSLRKPGTCVCSSFQRTLETGFFGKLQKIWLPACAGMTAHSEVSAGFTGAAYTAIASTSSGVSFSTIATQ